MMRSLLLGTLQTLGITAAVVAFGLTWAACAGHAPAPDFGAGGGAVCGTDAQCEAFDGRAI